MAIPALAQGATHGQVAELVGVHVNTIDRWMDIPEFRQAVEDEIMRHEVPPDLVERKPAAVWALARGVAHEKAAEIAGVHPRTISNWMARDEFSSMVKAEQAAIMDRLLQGALQDAADSAAVLRELRDNPEIAAKRGSRTRLQAAQTLYKTAMDGIRERLMPPAGKIIADRDGPREVVLEWNE